MRYLAGYVPQIADTVSVGIGSTLESATDRSLDFEIIAVPIKQVGIDLTARKVVFKVTLPQGVSGYIREIALWADRQMRLGSQSMLTLADEDTEIWTGGTWGTGSRVNESTRVLSPAASQKASATLYGFSRNLQQLGALDNFAAAFTVGANVASVELEFGLDDANYFRTTINAPLAGDKIHRVMKKDFVKTGTLDWSQVTQFRVSATATAAGAGEVKFDALRVDSADTDNAAVMVARKVLGAAYAKDLNEPLDIEYPLEVSI